MDESLQVPPKPIEFPNIDIDENHKQLLIHDFYHTLIWYPNPLHLYRQVSKSCNIPLLELLKSIDSNESNSRQREKLLLNYKYCVLSQIPPQIIGRKEMRSCMKNEIAKKQNQLAEHNCKPIIEKFEKKFNFLVKNMFSKNDWERLNKMQNDISLRKDIAFHIRCQEIIRELEDRKITTKTREENPLDPLQNASKLNHGHSTQEKNKTNQTNIDPESKKEYMKGRCDIVLKNIYKSIQSHIPETIQRESDTPSDIERKEQIQHDWYGVLIHAFPTETLKESI